LSWLCLSDRFVGNLLKGQTVGVIGAGRIGSAYARMMVIPYFLKYFQIECVKTLC
jgi:lactate dehydrogenase-like 2-hydroxyacid dehydrogenase